MQQHLCRTSAPPPSRIPGYRSQGLLEQLPGYAKYTSGSSSSGATWRSSRYDRRAGSQMDFCPGWRASAHATWLATASIPR